MTKLDYFTSASERWRTDAAQRARLIMSQRPVDALAYADKRMRLANLGSFERRRWRYIKSLLASKFGA